MFWKREEISELEQSRASVTSNTPQANLSATAVPSDSNKESAVIIPLDLHQPKIQKKRVFLKKGVALEADLVFDKDVEIAGHVIGDIFSPSAIKISKDASTKGSINAHSIEISGVHHGDINSKELVMVKESGAVTGNICSEKLSIEEGGVLNGEFSLLLENQLKKAV